MTDRARPKAVKKILPSEQKLSFAQRIIKQVNFQLKFQPREKPDKPKEYKPAIIEVTTEEQEQQQLIQSMTDWQRNQWARAGYKIAHVKKFAEMERPNHKVGALTNDQVKVENSVMWIGTL